MRTMKFMTAALVLPAVLGAIGCATLGRATFKEPIVHFQEARITSLGVTGGSLEVKLSVYNPNGFRLDGTSLTYNLVVDSARFGSGFGPDSGSGRGSCVTAVRNWVTVATFTSSA